MISFRDFMLQKVQEYYANLPFVGKDFYTAPELDKAFGYAIGDFLSQYLQSYPVVLELGAGNGTLAYDLLTFFEEKGLNVEYIIYETSTSLKKFQSKRLERFFNKVHWVDRLPDTFEGVVISNEFFDCFPVRVVKGWKELFVKDGEAFWKEIQDKRVFEFIRRMGYENVDTLLEVCLDCIDFLKELSSRLSKGYILTIDYGYRHPLEVPQGTVVGYKGHRLVQDVLKEEGTFDVTASVNFQALVEYGRDFGLETVFLKRLREFLLSSEGFMKELQELPLREDPESIQRLSRIKNILISMGERFWVLFQQKAHRSLSSSS